MIEDNRAIDIGISVVIPARNVAEVLPAQLDGLAAQRNPPLTWEIIIVDNGSTDSTAQVAASYRNRLPSLQIIDAHHKLGVNGARNAGVRAASHDWIAFCDGDDVVRSSWLRAYYEAVQQNPPCVLGGRLVPLLPRSRRTYGRPPPSDQLPRPLGFLPFALGGNQCIHRSVWETLGGFDETYDIPGSDDVDFSWRAQLAGFEVVHVRNAVVEYRYRDSLTAYLRQTFWFAVGQVRLFKDFRIHGARRRSALGVARSWCVLILTWPTVLIPRNEYAARWLRGLLRNLGYVYGSLRYCTLYF